MSYLGRSPIAHGFAKLDTITFDGVSTTYPLTKGGLPYLAGSALSLIVSLAGVIQEPLASFNVSGSNIIFADVHPVGTTFFAVSTANQYVVGSVTDGSITTAKLVDGSITNAKIGETLSVAKGGTGSTSVSGIRTTLGLGSAALLNVGTGANNIVQLDSSSKLPAVDGSQLTGISGGFSKFVNFTTVGTTNWTVPAGVTKVRIMAVGGGGGGRSANGDGVSTASQGGAGGSGCVVIGHVTNLVPGATISVTVGSAGVVDSSNGGNSSFGTYIIAGGGKISTVAGTGLPNPGGAAGTASGSVTDVTTIPFKATAGAGGSVADGSNGYLGATTPGSNTFSTYGTGGYGGGARSGSYIAYGGGNGTQGCLIIEY